MDKDYVIEEFCRLSTEVAHTLNVRAKLYDLPHVGFCHLCEKNNFSFQFDHRIFTFIEEAVRERFLNMSDKELQDLFEEHEEEEKEIELTEEQFEHMFSYIEAMKKKAASERFLESMKKRVDEKSKEVDTLKSTMLTSWGIKVAGEIKRRAEEKIEKDREEKEGTC